MALNLVLNGREEVFDNWHSEATLIQLASQLGLKPDRVAVEINGEIVRRGSWDSAVVHSGDTIEIVHFVGGGVDA